MNINKPHLSLQALAARTKNDCQAEEGSFNKAASVIAPVIVYYVINGVAFFVLTMGIRLLLSVSDNLAAVYTDHSRELAIAIQILSMAIGIAAVVPFLIHERPYLFGKNRKGSWIILSIIAGLSSSVTLNIIFNYLYSYLPSTTYNEVAERQFALPLWEGILFYGIIAAVVEEIVFRGIVYNRARRNYGLTISLFLTALLFGIYHGNLIQAVYGFVMGLLMCVIYERFGSLIYTIIFHASANSIVYTLSTSGFDPTPTALAMLCITCAIAATISMLSICSLK